MKTDPELLRSYIEDSSEEAFAELVRRHVNLVYSVALRKLGGDAALAQDTTQAVFTVLAAKAGTLGHIRHVAGWLYGTTRHTAAHAARAESRRQARERKAETMHEILGSTESSDLAAMPPEMLDEIMETLETTDREAILLRFFEKQSFIAVGVALRVSEDAARMRVARALETIRERFAKRGITSAAAAIAAALANQVTAAPSALAASVSSAALAGTAALATPVVKLGLLAFMTTTKTVPWFAAAVALGALGISGYEYRELTRQRVASARLGAERETLATALKQTEQRAATLDTHAAQAERTAAELERKIADLEARITATRIANLTPQRRLSAQERAEQEKVLAEKMVKLKPSLEAGTPIKGAAIVIVDGKAIQRPVEFVMGKETLVEGVDDGTYRITPTLNPDGSVEYKMVVTKADAANGKEITVASPAVIAIPWKTFTLAFGKGCVFAFDPDLPEP